MSNNQSINKSIGYEMHLCVGIRDVPLHLVQVNIENKDILCIYTSSHGQKRLNCPFPSPHKFG